MPEVVHRAKDVAETHSPGRPTLRRTRTPAPGGGRSAKPQLRRRSTERLRPPRSIGRGRFARALYQERQNVERLLLNFDADAALPQFAHPEVEFEDSEVEWRF